VSVGTLTIQLPARAAWWVKYLADREGRSVRSMLEVLVLRQLHITPGVDLSRSPAIFQKGVCDEQEG
jgi:hypothetical protein